jgi:hypothetical protein
MPAQPPGRRERDRPAPLRGLRLRALTPPAGSRARRVTLLWLSQPGRPGVAAPPARWPLGHLLPRRSETP